MTDLFSVKNFSGKHNTRKTMSFANEHMTVQETITEYSKTLLTRRNTRQYFFQNYGEENIPHDKNESLRPVDKAI